MEESERKIFVKNDLQYLITQTQVYAKSLDTSNYNNEIVEFNFNHLITEIIWVIQNGNVLDLYSYGGNEWFNFSTESYKNSKSKGSDPMLEGKFMIEGNDLTEEMTALVAKLRAAEQADGFFNNTDVFSKVMG